VAIQEACDGRGILLRKLDALDHKVHCKVTMRSVSTWPDQGMVPVKVAGYKNGSCAPANIRSTTRCGVSLLAFATSMREILADNTPRNSCPPNHMIS